MAVADTSLGFWRQKRRVLSSLALIQNRFSEKSAILTRFGSDKIKMSKLRASTGFVSTFSDHTFVRNVPQQGDKRPRSEIKPMSASDPKRPSGTI